MAIRAQGLKHILTVGARYLLASVFLLSALGKMYSPEGFKIFARSFPVPFAPDVVLWIVVGFEFLLVVLLLNPRTARFGGLVSFTSLLFFSGLLIYTNYVGESATPCGCFGEILPASSSDFSLLRNILLLLMTVPLIQGGAIISAPS